MSIKVQNGSGELSCSRSCGRILIGRAADCDLRIGRPDASRNHAEVYSDGESWYLKDLGSCNGTRLNNDDVRRLQPYRVFDGDMFTVAHVALYVHIDD